MVPSKPHLQASKRVTEDEHPERTAIVDTWYLPMICFEIPGFS